MRRAEHSPRAFQAPVDVHASADGQVYMFKRRTDDSAVSSDDEELSVMLMTPQRNVQLLERKLLHGDSLNKLALQYGCKVADIKRVNNLLQEQDLFALTSIKIPVQKHSLLTETYTDANEELMHSSALSVTPQDRARAQPYQQEATDFLMEVDNDIEKLIPTTSDFDEEVLDNLEEKKRFGFRRSRRPGHGADWGIQWWNAVVAMLLIGIILPLFYVIYMKTRDTKVVSPTDGVGALQSSIISSNHSGTGLRTNGMENFQGPG